VQLRIKLELNISRHILSSARSGWYKKWSIKTTSRRARAISWHTLILPGISLLLERCVGKSIFKMRFAACKKGEKLCVDVLSVFIGECSSIWQSVITQGITEITFLHVSVRAWLAAAKLTSVGISCLLLLCLISCLVTGRCCWLVG